MTHDNALRPLHPLLAFEGLAAAIKAEALGPRIGMVERHAAIAMKFNAPLPDFIDLVHVYPTSSAAKPNAIGRRQTLSVPACRGLDGGSILELRASTILARHHALSRFFGWLVDEGELTDSPMAQLPRLAVPLGEPTVLSAAQIETLLAACTGLAFEDLRDAAVIRLFVDTGLRLTEMAGVQLDDVDLEAGSVYPAGAGRTPRAVPSNDRRPAHCSAIWRPAPTTIELTYRRCGSDGADG